MSSSKRQTRNKRVTAKHVEPALDVDSVLDQLRTFARSGPLHVRVQRVSQFFASERGPSALVSGKNFRARLYFAANASTVSLLQQSLEANPKQTAYSETLFDSNHRYLFKNVWLLKRTEVNDDGDYVVSWKVREKTTPLLSDDQPYSSLVWTEATGLDNIGTVLKGYGWDGNGDVRDHLFEVASYTFTRLVFAQKPQDSSEANALPTIWVDIASWGTVADTIVYAVGTVDITDANAFKSLNSAIQAIDLAPAKLIAMALTGDLLLPEKFTESHERLLEQYRPIHLKKRAANPFAALHPLVDDDLSDDDCGEAIV